MKPQNTSTIVTANDLLTGEVVYLTDAGQWSPNHNDASLLDDDAANVKLTEVAQNDTSVVGPYVAGAISTGEQSSMPLHFREVFRTKGPSNRLVGKQAQIT